MVRRHFYYIPIFVFIVLAGWFCFSQAATTAEERASFRKDADEKLHILGDKIDALKEKGAEVKEGVESEFNKEMDTLKRKKRIVKRHLVKLKKVGEKGWEKAKIDFKSAVDDLEGHYNRLIERFK